MLKFQITPKLMLVISSGSKKKEPRYACLSEAMVSQSESTEVEEVAAAAAAAMPSGYLC